MNEINMDSLVAQMRMLSARAAGGPAAAATDGPGFGDLLQQALTTVSDSSKEAGRLAEAFESGAPDVTLPEVMIALQKSNVSFQAMTEVRNKLIAAYQEVMGMQL